MLQQPHPFDLIDNTIMISGLDVELKGNLSLNIGNGNYEIKEYIEVNNNQMKEFQAKVTIPKNIELKLDKIRLIVRDNSKKNSKKIVPLSYAPNILKDYSGFWLHKVAKGESLKTIANKYYKDQSKWDLIYSSNIDRITNPKKIYEGQILRIPKREEF